MHPVGDLPHLSTNNLRVQGPFIPPSGAPQTEAEPIITTDDLIEVVRNNQ